MWHRCEQITGTNQLGLKITGLQTSLQSVTNVPRMCDLQLVIMPTTCKQQAIHANKGMVLVAPDHQHHYQHQACDIGRQQAGHVRSCDTRQAHAKHPGGKAEQGLQTDAIKGGCEL